MLRRQRLGLRELRLGEADAVVHHRKLRFGLAHVDAVLAIVDARHHRTFREPLAHPCRQRPSRARPLRPRVAPRHAARRWRQPGIPGAPRVRKEVDSTTRLLSPWCTRWTGRQTGGFFSWGDSRGSNRIGANARILARISCTTTAAATRTLAAARRAVGWFRLRRRYDERFRCPHHAYCATSRPCGQGEGIRGHDPRDVRGDARDERLSRRRPDPRSVPAKTIRWWSASPARPPSSCGTSLRSERIFASGSCTWPRTNRPTAHSPDSRPGSRRRWYHPRCIRHADA